MPRQIRRAECAVSPQRTMEILHKGDYGVLSTLSADGQPYGVPVNYSFADNAIYFHCALQGHKLENLAATDRVSFCVVGETEILPDRFAMRYESAIVFGRAIELTGTEKQYGLSELLKKYSPNYLEAGRRYAKANAGRVRVYKIAIESLSGKSGR